jgi:hypothetical protein
MVTHKIENGKTACGLDLWKGQLEASSYRGEVNCKKCLSKKKEDKRRVPFEGTTILK